MGNTAIRNIRLFYIHNFLTDFQIQAVFLVIYFSQILGSYAAAMAILAAEQLTAAIMDIPTGIFSDRIGRKFTLAAGSMCYAVGIGCYALANNGLWLLIGAVLNGLGFCLFSGNNSALLYETLKDEGLEDQFHHYQGRTDSMFQLALGISAVCSSLMTSQGLRFIFMLGVIPQIMAVVVSLMFKEPSVRIKSERNGFVHLKQAFTKVIHTPRLRLLTIGQAISYGAGEASFNFRDAYINSLWPLWALGIYRGLNNACGFLGYWFSGRIIDRVTAPYLLAFSQIYWFLSSIFAIIVSNVISPFIFIIGATLYGPSFVASSKLLQSEFADEQRATMGSVVSFVGKLFYAIMALVIGLISDSYGLTVGLGFGIIVSATSLPIYIWLFKKHF